MSKTILIQLGDGPLKDRHAEIPKGCDECFLLCPDGSYAHYLRLHAMLTNEDGTRYFQPCPHLLPTGMEVFYQKPPEGAIPRTGRNEAGNEIPPGKFITGFDVYQWPEFNAFITRLGVPVRRDKTLTIRLTEDHATVVQEYLGADCRPDHLIDTTSMRNERLRTKEPRP